MDELLRDFLTETHESIDVVDVELVRFEQDPNNAKILNNVFRLVHTIKGTCGFLNLPRLEALTHAAEALMGKFRDGARVTGEAVTLVLATIDRVKILLDQLERNQAEPAGDDRDLIAKLERMAAATAAAGRRRRTRTSSTSSSARSAIRPRRAISRRAPHPLRPPRPPRPHRNRRFAPALRRRALPSAQSPQTDANGDTGRDEERADSKIANQSIRVHVDTLEHLMTMVSELVLTRNQLLDIGRRHEDSEFKAPLQRLSTVTAELQEGVMKTRMQPIGNAWQKLPRIVRDLSAELGKPIEFEMQGAETELDRQVLDLIKDPLIHMVRNSADHGLEMPAERRAAGKPEKGTIRLAAWHEGGHIIVEVSDDGRGLDTARIKSLAIARGLVSESEVDKMSESQIQKFIFMPGFSTASKVTSVSGRGVGMDVVRANMDQIGGVIDVKSVFGHGTSFIIKIPLTLAIVSALIVQCAGDRFAIPQLAVVELVRARNNSEHRIERIKDAAVLRLRNKLLPLFRLSSLLKIGEERRKRRRERLHRRHAGRQPDLRHRGRRRLPHRRDRGQADVGQAAAHPDVLRQHHPRRRLGDHDHRSERHRAEAFGLAVHAPRRGDRSRARARGRHGGIHAAVPRRLAAAEGGAAVAGHAARGDRFRNPSRPPTAAPVVQYRGQLMPLVPVNSDVAHQEQRLAAASGVLRRRPLHGPDGRRDRRHRRGAARYRVDEHHGGRPGLRGHQGPGDRGDRHRPLSAAGVRGLDALAASPDQRGAAPGPAGRRCRRSSATCWRRCSRPRAMS